VTAFHLFPSRAALPWVRPRAANVSAVLTDVAAWLIAVATAYIGRLDFQFNVVRWDVVWVLAMFMAAAQLGVASSLFLYRGRYQVGSFGELRALVVSVTSASVAAESILLLLRPAGVPRSLPLLAWALAVTAMMGIRYLKRVIIERHCLPRPDAERVVILGAGSVGSALALRMLRDSSSPFLPVAFLDDDTTKRNLHLHGIPVRGHFGDMSQVLQRLGVARVVVAINQADACLVRRISDAASALGVVCMVLPTLSDTLRLSQVQLSTLRNVNVEDVIGRRPVDTDLRSISQYITGRRVLVTGAGGSIGSELCRQLHKFGPSELVMLDHDESGLHATELSIYGHALLESAEIVLVDIRDAQELGRVFREHRPQVVFHAAALKHLTLLERYPYEALKSNVYGTLNVLDAAAANGVEHFVNISTDKAANPVSALGHSKRLAERLTAWYALRGTGKYLSVRFGNVLGSRGSVLHAFAAQIENGGPVTVTHPEVTRFFMTIPQACQLVIQAGAIGRAGEALVLDMGEPVKIVDVAARMIAMSGKEVDMVFTGLREGEKLHEELLGVGETDDRPLHPMVSHVTVPPMRPELIQAQDWTRAVMARHSCDSAIPLRALA